MLTSGMGRTVIVGDVHGCSAELSRLLDRVAFASGDRLVMVGDLVARGPDSLGVLDVVRQTGAILVRGNHEQRLLDLRRERDATTTGGGRMHKELAQALRPVDWTLLETSVLWLDLPEHGVRVVHAGVVPGVPIERHTPATLMRIRTVKLGRDGRPVSHDVAESEAPARRGPTTDVLWGAAYEGPPHVVFGHNAAPGLQLHPWATGLDTGCVYGGGLTAMVLAPGEKVPRSHRARRSVLTHQVAARTYFTPTGPHVSRAYAA